MFQSSSYFIQLPKEAIICLIIFAILSIYNSQYELTIADVAEGNLVSFFILLFSTVSTRFISSQIWFIDSQNITEFFSTVQCQNTVLRTLSFYAFPSFLDRLPWQNHQTIMWLTSFCVVSVYFYVIDYLALGFFSTLFFYVYDSYYNCDEVSCAICVCLQQGHTSHVFAIFLLCFPSSCTLSSSVNLLHR